MRKVSPVDCAFASAFTESHLIGRCSMKAFFRDTVCYFGMENNGVTATVRPLRRRVVDDTLNVCHWSPDDVGDAGANARARRHDARPCRSICCRIRL